MIIKKVSIVLPAYNEEQNLLRINSELLPVLESLKEDYEIIIIDDGSKDNTFSTAKNLSLENKKIKVVQHQKNSGLGATIRTGINSATGDLLITLDADFTFHPKQIPHLINEIKNTNADCVIGSPVKGGYSEEIPKYRIFLSSCINILYWIALGHNISAVTPIFRIYKTQQVRELTLSSNGFDINAEILFLLLANKRKVIEIPAKLTVRKFGKSKMDNFKAVKLHLTLLMKIIGWRIKNALRKI